MEPIKLLRAYHLVESRKKKVPPLNVSLCGNSAFMRFDNKTNAFVIDASPETVYKILKGYNLTHLISEGIDIEDLKNNYHVSRFLANFA